MASPISTTYGVVYLIGTIGPLSINGDLTPGVDATYSLGSASLNYKAGFFGGAVAIGTTTTAALTLQNLTAAAAGAQQYSPGFSLVGQGWSTNGAGASMPVETRWEVRPVQGAAAPTFAHVMMGRVNNAAWADLYTVFSNGNFNIGTGVSGYRFTIVGSAVTTNIATFANSNWNNTSAGSGLIIGTGAVTGDTYTTIQAYQQGSAAFQDLVLQPSDRKVGIGTPTPVANVALGTNTGQEFGLDYNTELTTIAAAATTDTAIQIPADVIVMGVSVRVTTVIPTAATFTVTGTTTATAFQTGASVSTAADTTDVGTKSCPYLNTAAQTIRITPNAQPADNTGRVRVTIHFIRVTAPTS